MAYDIARSGPFDSTGGNGYSLYLYVRRDLTDVANNRSSYAWQLKIVFTSGVNLRWSSDPHTFGVTVGSQTFYPSAAPDMRGVSERVLGSGTTGWFSHDSNGNLNINVRAWANSVPSFGGADTGSNTFATDKITRPPSAVTNLNIQGIQANQANIVFSPVANDGGGVVTGYDYQAATNSGFSPVLRSGITGASPVTVTGLPANDQIWARVRAVNAAGPGPWATVSFTTLTGLPAAPPSLARSFTAPTRIDLSWGAPAISGGGTILQYEVQRATNSAFTAGIANIDAGTARTLFRTDQAVGTSYWYRVRARTASGWGPYSGAVSYALPDTPGTPAQNALAFSAPTTVTASWATPTSGGAAILEYQVQYDTVSNFASPATVSAGMALSRAIAVTRGTTVYTRVRARNSQGWGDWSAARSYGIPNVPATPALNALTFSAPNTLGSSWVAPANNGAAITGYQVQWSTSSTFTSVGGADVSGTSHNITGLAIGSTHWVRVRAGNSQGWGAWSAARSYAIPNVPGVPNAPTLAFTAPSTIATSWPLPVNNGATITSYQLERRTGTTNTVIYSGPNRAFTATGLPAGAHSFRVRAYSSQGWGAWSPYSAYTVPGVPNAPGGLTVGTPTPTSLRASFSLPGNNGAALTGHQLQYSTSATFATATTVALGAAVTAATVTGLASSQVYYFRVRSSNSQGWGAWSATTAGTTLSPAAPTLLVTASPDGRSALLRMGPPGGATGVTQYDVERRIGTGAATTFTTTTTTLSVTALVPGQAYQWRASARFGTAYTSPFSAWQTVTQPKPDTNPGDYFDGATPAKGGVSYSWSGAANASTSLAIAPNVRAWAASSAVGGDPILHRIQGGRFGPYGARATMRMDATGAGVYVGQSNVAEAHAEIVGNTPYAGSIYVRPSRPQALSAQVVFLNAARVEVGPRIQGEAILVTNLTSYTRLHVIGHSPATAVYAFVRATDAFGAGVDGWSPFQSGESLDVDAAMISLAPLLGYFDGSFGATPSFRYEWLGAANASASIRYTQDPDEMDPLRDPDCDPIPRPPKPPTIPADCIVAVGLWRRYTFEIPETEVGRWSAMLPTLTLRTDDAAERQIRIRYYANPDGTLQPDMELPGWESEIILTYMPANTVITIDPVARRVSASVNGGEERSASNLMYGTDGVPATWPELKCGVGYLVTLDVPTEAPAGNLSMGVTLTQRR